MVCRAEAENGKTTLRVPRVPKNWPQLDPGESSVSPKPVADLAEFRVSYSSGLVRRAGNHAGYAMGLLWTIAITLPSLGCSISYERPSILAYQRLREGTPEDIGTLKRYEPPSDAPTFKTKAFYCVVAEDPCAKPGQAKGHPFLHGTGRYRRSIDGRSHRYSPKTAMMWVFVLWFGK